MQYESNLKTKGGNLVTVRVSLKDKAKAILEKYKNYPGVKRLPFISEQKYNDAIKKRLNWLR